MLNNLNSRRDRENAKKLFNCLFTLAEFSRVLRLQELWIEFSDRSDAM
jgi:hypothetical protein